MPKTTNATLLMKTGSDAGRATTILKNGEIGRSNDAGRVTVGDGVRPGGNLLPSSSYATVIGQVALAQGTYIFEANNTLLLPHPNAMVNGVYLVYPGEYIKVVTTHQAIANGDCIVKVDDSLGVELIRIYVDGVPGEHNELQLDLVYEVTLILRNDRRWELT